MISVRLQVTAFRSSFSLCSHRSSGAEAGQIPPESKAPASAAVLVRSSGSNATSISDLAGGSDLQRATVRGSNPGAQGISCPGRFGCA